MSMVPFTSSGISVVPMIVTWRTSNFSIFNSAFTASTMRLLSLIFFYAP